MSAIITDDLGTKSEELPIVGNTFLEGNGTISNPIRIVDDEDQFPAGNQKETPVAVEISGEKVQLTLDNRDNEHSVTKPQDTNETSLEDHLAEQKLPLMGDVKGPKMETFQNQTGGSVESKSSNKLSKDGSEQNPRMLEPREISDEIEPNPVKLQTPITVVFDISDANDNGQIPPQPLMIDEIEQDVRRREQKDLAPLQVYGTYFGVDDVGYQGYKLVSPRDFQEENVLSTPATNFTVDKINPDMLRDNSKSSKTLIIFISVLSLALLTLLMWQVLIGKCLVTGLCEANDRSTDLNAAYLFKTFDFRVPTSFVWTNLVGGTFGMLMASILAFLILRNSVGSAKMVQASTLIRKGSVLFLGQQSIGFVIPFILFFVLFGVKVNWETAGSFGIGALLSITTDFIARGIGSRGSIRAAAASYAGVDQGMRLSFRIAVAVSLSVLGMSLFGISSVYLMFSDVRALGGFAAGAATSALFLRISGCLFGASIRTLETQARWEQYRSEKKTVAQILASCVQRSSVMGPDWFVSNVSSILATAILASSLPFFFRDSFAMCIYNHLNIDQECGPFGKSKTLSYAVFICRSENLYLSYPNLPTWSSISAFVAVPFLIAFVGLLACAAFAMHLRFVGISFKSHSSLVTNVRKKSVVSVVLGGGILILSFAAICFGLFGPSSSFYSQKGFGGGSKLQRMVLDGSETQCLTQSLSVNDLDSPLPIPSGGRMILDNYRPTTSSGRNLGAVSATAWKLFLCCLIGFFVAIAISGFCGMFFASDSYKPAAAVQKAAKSGTDALVLQCLANGMLCSLGGSILIFAALMSSFYLYDAFGVGVTTVAYMSMGGVACTAVALGSVGRSVHDISCVTSQTRAARNSGVVEGITAQIGAAGASFLQGASVLTGFTLILATLQQAGLQLSPRDLVGGPEQPPAKLISSSGLIPIDVLVVCGLVIGSVLPLIIAGTLWTAARQHSVLTLRRRGKDSVRHIGLLSLLESILPVGIALLSPFVVGFGLGYRALIGMAMSSVFSSYVVGCISWTFGTCIQKGCATLGSVKQIRSARRAKSLAWTLLEVVEPAMRSVSKMFAALSLVFVLLTPPDTSRAWIGGILFAIIALGVWAYVMWLYCGRTRKTSESALPLHASRPVSPFFVESPTFDPVNVVPGSQMSEALLAFGGQPKLPVSPQVLPGLSRRSRAEFTSITLEPLNSPRVGNSTVVSSSVLRDDTGRTPRGDRTT
eukprot:TRINITY_DN8839_c0_g1_i1.p1 TRINITY_DN8839_c0_g1~~TRINITY_DN8839_c0_g1_i1.p1  ORF type:complete len:1223 (-),score=106.86 TRINITY_DN8839_c0_g1_i1:3987-7655(-)